MKNSLYSIKDFSSFQLPFFYFIFFYYPTSSFLFLWGVNLSLFLYKITMLDFGDEFVWVANKIFHISNKSSSESYLMIIGFILIDD